MVSWGCTPSCASLSDEQQALERALYDAWRCAFWSCDNTTVLLEHALEALLWNMEWALNPMGPLCTEKQWHVLARLWEHVYRDHRYCRRNREAAMARIAAAGTLRDGRQWREVQRQAEDRAIQKWQDATTAAAARTAGLVAAAAATAAAGDATMHAERAAAAVQAAQQRDQARRTAAMVAAAVAAAAAADATTCAAEAAQVTMAAQRDKARRTAWRRAEAQRALVEAGAQARACLARQEEARREHDQRRQRTALARQEAAAHHKKQQQHKQTRDRALKATERAENAALDAAIANVQQERRAWLANSQAQCAARCAARVALGASAAAAKAARVAHEAATMQLTVQQRTAIMLEKVRKTREALDNYDRGIAQLLVTDGDVRYLPVFPDRMRCLGKMLFEAKEPQSLKTIWAQLAEKRHSTPWLVHLLVVHSEANVPPTRMRVAVHAESFEMVKSFFVNYATTYILRHGAGLHREPCMPSAEAFLSEQKEQEWRTAFSTSFRVIKMIPSRLEFRVPVKDLLDDLNAALQPALLKDGLQSEAYQIVMQRDDDEA